MGKREQNRQAQRQRIVEAAFCLFASKGFEEVTVAEVAQEAGVSRATVFTYFASKRALVDAMTARVMEYYLGMLDRALDTPESSVPSLIRALFDSMGTGIEAYRDFHRGIFREIAKLRTGLDEGDAAGVVREEVHGRLVKLFERGQDRGEISRQYPVRSLIVAYDNLVNGTIVDWLFEDSSEPLRIRMQRAADILLGPVQAQIPSVSDEPLPDLTPIGMPSPGQASDFFVQGDRNDSK